MLNGFPKLSLHDRRARGLGLAALVVLLAVTAWLGVTFGWLAAAALLVALTGWGAALLFWAALRGRQEPGLALEDQPQASAQAAAAGWASRLDAVKQADSARRAETRLQAMIRLNHSLAEASAGLIDDRELMDSALSIVNETVGALGSSFVPIDEWQQPLPAFTHGKLPNLILSAWAVQLANGMLRERCGSCKILESAPGGCPLHPAQVGNVLTVQCIPLHHINKERNAEADRQAGLVPPLDLGANEDAGEERPIGVLHLYLPPGSSLDAETRVFLDEVMNQIALAYQAARLRQQEQVTLRQLHMLHAPESDFAASLDILLDGLVQALEVDFALIRVRPIPEAGMQAVNITSGDLSALAEGEFDRITSQAFGLALRGKAAASETGRVPVWLAQPLLLTDGSLLDGNTQASSRGVLLVGVNRPLEFHPRQRSILQAIASQAALLIENERLVRSLEYKIVIQERARLAREIHDGLAQTLAFLKIQAAQMQSYLAQGDLTRLSNILKDNYQALAEAYLDTRQAIDDLRLTPQEGLDHWLEHILAEFENVTHLVVERDIRPLERPLAPEVQAQLVRIVQEALSNVRKHARASRVRISLFEQGGETILEVHDNGQGFAAEDIPDFTRHGLRGMRERAELLGADFQIISQAQQGTTMRLVLPASLAEEPTR